MADAVRAQVLRADATGYAEACLAIRPVDWRAQLARIGCPVQVVAGSADLGSTVEMARAIVEAVPGAQLSVLEAAHLSVLEQPQAFSAALAGLLSRLA